VPAKSKRATVNKLAARCQLAALDLRVCALVACRPPRSAYELLPALASA